MKGKTKAIITVFVVILAGIYYYAAIPAINIHSSETWFFIMIFLVILAVLYLGRKKMNRYEVRESKVVKGFLGVIVFLGVVYLLGTLFSSPVINAKKYQKLMTVIGVFAIPERRPCSYKVAVKHILMSLCPYFSADVNCVCLVYHIL